MLHQHRARSKSCDDPAWCQGRRGGSERGKLRKAANASDIQAAEAFWRFGQTDLQQKPSPCLQHSIKKYPCDCEGAVDSKTNHLISLWRQGPARLISTYCDCEISGLRRGRKRGEGKMEVDGKRREDGRRWRKKERWTTKSSFAVK